MKLETKEEFVKGNHLVGPDWPDSVVDQLYEDYCKHPEDFYAYDDLGDPDLETLFMAEQQGLKE